MLLYQYVELSFCCRLKSKELSSKFVYAFEIVEIYQNVFHLTVHYHFVSAILLVDNVFRFYFVFVCAFIAFVGDNHCLKDNNTHK